MQGKEAREAFPFGGKRRKKLDALLERENGVYPLWSAREERRLFCAATRLTPPCACVSPPWPVAFISALGKSGAVGACVETQRLLCTHAHRTMMRQSIVG